MDAAARNAPRPLRKRADASTSSIFWAQAKIEPGQTRRLYFKQPYVDLPDEQELRRFKEISFEQELPTVLKILAEALDTECVNGCLSRH